MERLACLKVLAALTAQPTLLLEKGEPGFAATAEVRAAANRLIVAIQEAVRAKRGWTGKKAKASRVRHGAGAAAASNVHPVEPAVALSPAVPSLGQRPCYVCQQHFMEAHPSYPALCVSCGVFNKNRRERTADLSGRVALVTGARVRIGYQAALKLLRAGANVEATTRFPWDAARRFAQETDFSTWADRLQIHGLDLRDLAAVERFADDMRVGERALDILINNAAQTVRRPPAFYAHLLRAETLGPASHPAQVAALVSTRSYHAALPGRLPTGIASSAEEKSPLDLEETARSALLAVLPLLPGDERIHRDLFPPGQLDRDGQQVDLRARNSWSARLEEIAPIELAETQCVNALAPFLLLRRLLAALRRSRFSRRFVVNVAAKEGRFDGRREQGTHPHTNMAKAALNMLTRTVATELADEGIFVCSVDPGWVSDQRPTSALDDGPRRDFVPPLDALDGAARILDPILAGVTEASVPAHGVLLKDYRIVSW